MRPASRARAPAGGGGAGRARRRVTAAGILGVAAAPTASSTASSTAAPAVRQWTRNSTLPSAPRSGDAMTRDRHEPGRRRARRTTSSSTARWTAGSRTTPPRPTALASRLELRLHQQHEVGVGGRAPRAAPARTRAQRDERQVGDHERHRPAEAPASRCAHVGALAHVDPRVGAQRPRELAVPDVDGHHLRAPRCSRQSVNPPVEAPASSARMPVTSTPKRVERGLELVAAPGHVPARLAGARDRLVAATWRAGAVCRRARDRGPGRVEHLDGPAPTGHQPAADELDIQPPAHRATATLSPAFGGLRRPLLGAWASSPPPPSRPFLPAA